ncbi:MAG: SAM-dependent chlorinase/fluorinase [Bacteroidota bacterium]
MAIITFLSDFGESDHYVAAVKAKIIQTNPGLTIIDITHRIKLSDIAHASHTLKSVFRDFPKGTVHLAAVGLMDAKKVKFIAMKMEDHYFVGPDNGLFSLVSDESLGTAVDININEVKHNFPAKEIFAPIAAKLASGTSIHDLGKPVEQINRMLGRAPRATKKQIAGHVIRVDHYGNLVTNISKTDFDILSKGKKYHITFGRETAGRVHHGYEMAEPGDCFLLFNSLGFLEIGINQGNAAQLLGLGYDCPVNIHFDE